MAYPGKNLPWTTYNWFVEHLEILPPREEATWRSA